MVHALRESRVAAALGVAVLIGVGVGSCGGDGDGGMEPTTSRIDAMVTLDDAAASGVPVRLFASSGGSALSTRSTGSAGTAAFTGLDAGSYEVEVEVPSGAETAPGEDDRKPVSVAAGGTASVDFELVTAGGGGPQVEVMLAGVSFSPSTVTIDAGTTVVWRNAAAVFHTITPDGHSEWQRATLNQANQTFTHTFNTPGTYAYYCEPHQSQGMTGTITVQ